MQQALAATVRTPLGHQRERHRIEKAEAVFAAAPVLETGEFMDHRMFEAA